MPNNYIDQVKLTNNTVVDIKDTVSGYITTAQAPVQSVNGQTGTVSLSIPSTASDVGAIAAPSSASSGQFLKYNGTTWIADNVPGGASPSDTTPSESTETGSAGTSNAYSRGDHSHPKEVIYIEYEGSASLTEIKDWWDAGKAVFVNCNFTSTVGAISLPCVNCTSSLAKFSASWNGVEYWADFDGVEWDSGEIELLADTKTSFYGTSSTGATTQAKTTSSTDYALRTGNIIAVKFSNANTYTSAKITLNVSSTGAKDVWYQGAVTSSSNPLMWNANQTLTFVYTGSVYICISKDDKVPDVTFVEYGVATESEVYAAQGNGKLVIAFDRNRVRRCAPLVYYAPASKYVFSFIDQDGSVELWQLSDNGTNTWSSSTGDYYVPSTRTVNSKALSSNITLDADDVGALASDGVAGRSRRLQEYDSRNVNDTPSALISSPGAGVFSDFKTTTVINTGEAPTKAYYQVISYVPWSDNSGGLPVQMALADKAGVPLIYTRSASSTSAWGSWKKLAFTDSDITGNAATADSAETLSATLGVGKGGTGKTSFTANQAIISGSTTTGAFTSRAITNNTATSTAITGSTNLVTMNTLRYAINRTTSVAAADTNYTTYMARGESLVTTDTTPTNNGEIAWVYG